MDAETMPRREWQGVRAFAWQVWPWMNWLLPMYFCFHGWLHGSGGWESLILTLASVVIVPAAGLLGSLPRFVLRRRGHRAAPAMIVPVLFVNWWAWFILSVTMPGTGDSGPIDSSLDSIIGREVQGQEGAMALSGFVGIITWIVILVLATALEKPRDDSSDRIWNITSLLVGIALPVAFTLLVAGALFFADHRRDAAGHTAGEVAGMTQREQAVIAEQGWDEMQASLSEVRGLIAADDWVYTGSGLLHDPDECRTARPSCYGLHASFSLSGQGEVDVREVLTELADQGWRVNIARQQATDAEGRTITIDDEVLGGIDVEVEIAASFWWGYAYEFDSALEVTEPQEIYATGSWPGLGR